MNAEFKNIEFNIKEKKEFFNSLSSLYLSGLPLGDTFRSMINSTRNIKIRDVSILISRQIDKGKTLEEAIEPCSNIIGKAYTKLLSAGEKSGKLENILSDICSNIAKQQEIQSDLITALIYPVSMFLFAFAVALLFQFFVIPSFRSVADYSMKTNTSFLFITAIIKIIIIFALLFGAYIYVTKKPALLKKIKDFFASLPIIKGILTNYYFTNFFNIMALAYDAGIPVIECVMLANSVIGIDNIKNKIKNAVKMIENGTPVSRALNTTGVFSGFAMSQVSAGEESGRLDKTLKVAAKDYQDQMDLSIKAMMKLLGPLVIILVGIMVGIIVIRGYSEYYKAIFSMLWNLNQYFRSPKY